MKRDELARKQRWSLAEARALLGWGERRLRRWMRKHGLRGSWLYAKQLQKLAPGAFAQRVASEQKPDTADAPSEGNRGVAHVVPVRAVDKPRLRQHDEAYFHRQYFIAGMSLRRLAELHDLSRRAVDAAIQRHERRQCETQAAETARLAAHRAQARTGS